MSISANPFNVAYLPYLGQDAPNPRNTFYRRRAPTNSDRRLYKIGDRWIDAASQIAYILVGKTATTANWVQFGGAPAVTSLNGLIGALSIIDQLSLGAITVTVPGSAGPTSIGLEVNVDGVTITRVGDQLVAGGTVGQMLTGDIGGAQPFLAGNFNIQGGAAGAIQFNSSAPGQMDAQVLVDGTTIQIIGNQLVATNTIKWVDTSPPTAAVAFFGYFALNAGSILLPLAPAQGTTIEIVDSCGGGVDVTGSVGDSIRLQNQITAPGGSVQSTQFGDCLRLVYRTVGATWFQVGGGAGGIWV